MELKANNNDAVSTRDSIMDFFRVSRFGITKDYNYISLYYNLDVKRPNCVDNEDSQQRLKLHLEDSPLGSSHFTHTEARQHSPAGTSAGSIFKL